MIRDAHWESTILNHTLYDENGLAAASIAEDLEDGKFHYWVYLPSNKIKDYAWGDKDTLEAARFISEMLAIKAGWRFNYRKV